PVVVFVTLVISSLIRRRWRRFAVLVGLTVLASVALGVYWLRSDIQTMPAIEHYAGGEWHQLAIPGAYLVGVLASIGWGLRRTARLMMKLGKRRRAVTVNPS